MEKPEQILENTEGNEEERARAAETLNLDPSISWDEMGEAYFRFNLAQQYSPDNKLDKEKLEKAKEEYLEKWNDPSFRKEEYAKHGDIGEKIRKAEEENKEIIKRKEESNEQPSEELKEEKEEDEKLPEEGTEEKPEESEEKPKDTPPKQENENKSDKLDDIGRKNYPDRKQTAIDLGYPEGLSWEGIVYKRAKEVGMNPEELKSGHEWPTINFEILKKLGFEKVKSASLEDFNKPIDWINDLASDIKKGEVEFEIIRPDRDKWKEMILTKYGYRIKPIKNNSKIGVTPNSSTLYEIKKNNNNG